MHGQRFCRWTLTLMMTQVTSACPLPLAGASPSASLPAGMSSLALSSLSSCETSRPPARESAWSRSSTVATTRSTSSLTSFAPMVTHPTCARGQRARETGLADDARFAASFARSKALSGWGRARIERELVRRGVLVEDELADDELFSEDAELERARRLASRRVRGDRSDFPRVVCLLCSKGYSYDLSMRVARELTSDGHVMD